jgi:calcineurin-like phosphoesterase family protein
MTVWFTSDLHIGHGRVAELRGFADVETHDQIIFDNWSRRVGEDDQVWILGDLAVSNPTRAIFEMHGLPGVKHLIAGNHDPVHPMHRDAHKWQARYLEAFASVQPFARRKFAGREILLSHFPYTADRGETRYPQWRLPDLGAWLFHGHTHSASKVTSPRELHVGLDAWDMAPVSLDKLIDGFIAEAGVA